MQRLSPVAARLKSSASAPSLQSLTSSWSECLKTRASVRCSFSSSICCRRVLRVFSHWRGRSPVSTAGGLSNLGMYSKKSVNARTESSMSFFSWSSFRRLALSSSTACAARRRSSASFSIFRLCSSLSFALSPQLLFIICSISFSCFSNFSFSASRSASDRPLLAEAKPPPVPAGPSFFFSSSTSAFSREICEASSFFVAETLMALARLA
mmetsp:Transcript_18977/g.50144  ORF Transcript_18977/g.50144 Transcript_18977/m.50144 type:complete len:210 (-) Transcript_18977:1179-1808(-)